MSEPMLSADEPEATRATAHLPGLDIEIIHRVSPDRAAEQFSINLQAVPSFEAFGHWIEAANPFAFWLRAAQLFWSPWLGITKAGLLPRTSAPQLAPHAGESPSDESP